MSVLEKKVKMANMFAGVATIVAIGAGVYSFQTQTTVTKSLSEPTYVWSKDGMCYDEVIRDGIRECKVEPAIPISGTNGLCLNPYVDPKCN